MTMRKQILVTVDTDLTDGQIEHHAATLYLYEGNDGEYGDLPHKALDVVVIKGRVRPRPPAPPEAAVQPAQAPKADLLPQGAREGYETLTAALREPYAVPHNPGEGAARDPVQRITEEAQRLGTRHDEALLEVERLKGKLRSATQCSRKDCPCWQ